MRAFASMTAEFSIASLPSALPLAPSSLPDQAGTELRFASTVIYSDCIKVPRNNFVLIFWRNHLFFALQEMQNNFFSAM